MPTWAWPVPGVSYISSGYGMRDGGFHHGIDIADNGDPAIVASRAGTVTNVISGCPHDYSKYYSCGCGGGYGNYLDVDHGNGWLTRYAHCSKILVSVGTKVSQGQKIAIMGSTGYSTGDHLHFEIRKDSASQDPSNYVNSSNTVAVIEASSNKLQEFIDTGRSHVGEHGNWVWETCGLASGTAWCAAFVKACAKTVGGLLGTVIPDTCATGEIVRQGTNGNMGKYIPGPYHGGKGTPQPGDIVGFHKEPGDKYSCRHVGIVYDVSNSRVSTVEGNTNTWDNRTSVIDEHDYSLTDSEIVWYYRPDWSKVGGGSYNGSSLLSVGQLYPVLNTEEDAIIREIGYIVNNKPSISTSNIKLSVINYTTGLSNVLSGAGLLTDASTAVYGDCEVDFSGIGNNNASIIGEGLMSKGLNLAITIGFLANIQEESGYDPSAVNPYSGASGICQWLDEKPNDGRYTRMVKRCGPNWKTNLSGQVDFIWYELETSENYAYECLIAQITSNTEAMAMEAAKLVSKLYERGGLSPAARLALAAARAAVADDLWDKVKIIERSNTSYAGPSLLDIPANKVDKKYKGTTWPLTKGQREFLECVVMGEYGQDIVGAKLIAQCLRDALVCGDLKDPMDARKSAPYGMGYDGYQSPANQISKDAIKYIFDEGKYVVQHRILFMYATNYCTSAWHESQNFIVQYEHVRFFDKW